MVTGGVESLGVTTWAMLKLRVWVASGFPAASTLEKVRTCGPAAETAKGPV